MSSNITLRRSGLGPTSDPHQLLTPEWISRLTHYTRLIVGFSGGLDSTVLLHALASHPDLHPKLLAVHVNHSISPNAVSWQKHCEQMCQQLNIAFLSRTVQFDQSANLEERARQARYAVFSSVLTVQDCLVLGHHQDDQAETVLLQLFRGAGIDGLAAMPDSGFMGLGELARPFLSLSRTQLEHYAQTHQLTWIEDESNQDISYSRNYLRHQILPLLVKKWPGAVGNIARTAIHNQHAKMNLDALATQDYQEFTLTQDSLFIEPLSHLSFERSVNILRVWLRNNQIQLPSTVTFHRLIHEVIFARQDAMPEVSWGEVVVRRYQKYLYLDKKNTSSPPSSIEWSEFPAPLMIERVGMQLQAQSSNQGLAIPEHAKLTIRFRQGGEAFCWHGQTKQLKKLFQEWEVPPWRRECIPLLYINEELAAVIGYAVSDLFFKRNVPGTWMVSTSE